MENTNKIYCSKSCHGPCKCLAQQQQNNEARNVVTHSLLVSLKGQFHQAASSGPIRSPQNNFFLTIFYGVIPIL